MNVPVGELSTVSPTGRESVRLLMGRQESIMNRTEILLEIAELHREMADFEADF